MTGHEHRPAVRFYEVDQQGVVYHMWFHAYFEDARNQLLATLGSSLQAIQERGLDLQVVAFQLEWLRPVRWGDDLRVGVEVLRLGTSSLDVAYTANVDGDRRANGAATYVLVSSTEGRSTPWPDDLRHALTPKARG